MPVKINNYTLADLKPVTLVYDYYTKQDFKHQLVSLQGGLTFCKHDVLQNYKDAALSNKTCLMLTTVKTLSSVFANFGKTVSAGTISGSLFLKTDNNYIKHFEHQLFVGGVGEKLFINIVPISGSLSELRINKTQYIRIDDDYPYTARIANEATGTANASNRLFDVEYSKGLISFRVLTKEGYRFLSFGSDRIVRAVGLELNDTIVNPCRFKAEFKTAPTLNYNTLPESSEIKYFNELFSSENRNNLNIKHERTKSTNFLISCPTIRASETDEVNVNVAMLKTNFTSTGTFLPSI